MEARLQQTPQHSVSVAGVILDDTSSRVLLIQRRDNGHWEPPGGVLELDETIEDGLRREIKEETGVEVTVGQLTGVYKNMARGIVNLVFRCAALTDALTSTPEASAVSWFPVSDIEKLMAPAYAVRVTDATTSRTTSVRAHDGARIVDKAAGRTADQVNEDIEPDKTMSAAEAKEYGLIDEVLESRKTSFEK